MQIREGVLCKSEKGSCANQRSAIKLFHLNWQHQDTEADSHGKWIGPRAHSKSGSRVINLLDISLQWYLERAAIVTF